MVKTDIEKLEEYRKAIEQLSADDLIKERNIQADKALYTTWSSGRSPRAYQHKNKTAEYKKKYCEAELKERGFKHKWYSSKKWTN